VTVWLSKELEIIYVGKVRNGKIHDKKLLEKEVWVYKLLKVKEVYMDKWYEWIEWKNIVKPKKKPKKKELTKEEKENNKLINSIRVKIEHAIGKLKNYKMLSWKLRIRLIWNFKSVKMNLKQSIFNIVVWLYNLNFLF